MTLPFQMSSNRQRYLMLALFFLVAESSHAEPPAVPYWPQFRGPTGQGDAGSPNIPIEFNESNLLIWKQLLPGVGWSSPVIWRDQVWVTTAVPVSKTPPTLSLKAIGVDFKTGEIQQEIELFKIENPEEIHADNSYASPTPVVDANNVYCHFGTFGTAAISQKTGQILWKNTEFEIEHQGGPGSSPILYDDLLILTCDGANAQYVVALEKNSGNIRWKRDRSAPFRENPITHRAFASPFVWKRPSQILLISPAADQVHAYNPQTGKEYWHVRYTGFSNVPVPVANDEMTFVCTGFFETELLAIRPDGSGNVTESHVAWIHDRSVSTIPSPILANHLLFSVNESGLLVCLNPETGKIEGRRRFVGNYSASPILAKDKLYFCSEEGKISIISADQEMELVQVNRLDGVLKASPAVAADSLLIRSDQHLYRFAHSTSGSQ